MRFFKCVFATHFYKFNIRLHLTYHRYIFIVKFYLCLCADKYISCPSEFSARSTLSFVCRFSVHSTLTNLQWKVSCAIKSCTKVVPKPLLKYLCITFVIPTQKHSQLQLQSSDKRTFMTLLPQHVTPLCLLFWNSREAARYDGYAPAYSLFAWKATIFIVVDYFIKIPYWETLSRKICFKQAEVFFIWAVIFSM